MLVGLYHSSALHGWLLFQRKPFQQNTVEQQKYRIFLRKNSDKHEYGNIFRIIYV